MPDKAAFNTIYTSLSPVIYGIAIRIAKDKPLADNILLGVFQCFYTAGLLATDKPIPARVFLPIIFKCIAKELGSQLPEREIRDRIDKESKSLKQGQWL